MNVQNIELVEISKGRFSLEGRFGERGDEFYFATLLENDKSAESFIQSLRECANLIEERL